MPTKDGEPTPEEKRATAKKLMGVLDSAEELMSKVGAGKGGLDLSILKTAVEELKKFNANHKATMDKLDSIEGLVKGIAEVIVEREDEG